MKLPWQLASVSSKHILSSSSSHNIRKSSDHICQGVSSKHELSSSSSNNRSENHRITIARVFPRNTNWAPRALIISEKHRITFARVFPRNTHCMGSSSSYNSPKIIGSHLQSYRCFLETRIILELLESSIILSESHRIAFAKMFPRNTAAHLTSEIYRTQPPGGCIETRFQPTGASSIVRRLMDLTRFSQVGNTETTIIVDLGDSAGRNSVDNAMRTYMHVSTIFVI